MEAAVAMCRYRSHKEVFAEEITAIEPNVANGSAVLRLSNGGFKDVSLRWIDAKEAKVGGYFVVYQDGYMSFSPASPFEEGYTAVSMFRLTFGRALEELQAGKRMRRSGWNGKGMWVELQQPDTHSKMSLPYIFIEYPAGHAAYPEGSRVPWLASQTDMLASDWEWAHDA